jgi:BirA family transcriptional regulator, biotin operon repressor / biotin---[acetyl-CoA-carboxylase] ligase
MKFKIYKFKKVTSTNDLAIKLIKEKKEINGYINADLQTKGRGTHGKKWLSKKGNLLGSFFFPLNKKLPPFNEFAMINAIIVSDVIQKYCKKKIVSLKYPNDIFLNGKKICGILQELVTINNQNFLIVGIGLNIISNPKIKTKYEITNIYSETKKKPKISEIVNNLVMAYENFFLNINTYSYIKFKKKAELKVIK